ncbi:hypothetical protein EAS68_06730 [Legionella jordanis]|uniref:DUF5630 domain-containing protein n=1 Tax=Legionella jordanis TaxID=456 RepID=UPI000EFECEC6|nr:DUF5630 domain-containing protein [Legionella jordanis]RMX19126.1 hypothetical protein EAS68_06730 [Legionella jordanis]
MFNNHPPPSLNEFKRLNAAESLLLHEIKQAPAADNISRVMQLIEKGSLDIIVKLAFNDDDFRKLCKNQIFSNEWLKLWSTYGIILTNDPGNALYSQEIPHPFDLLLGIFFYHKAIEVSRYYEKDFTNMELTYLEEAIRYESIHAQKRLNFYWYEQFQFGNMEKVLIKEKFLVLIAQIKKLHYYGSYAYVMLAEAFLRFADFLKNDSQLKKKCLNAALEACQHAEAEAENSDKLLFNASLGRGLGHSNSYNFESYEQIRQFISSFNRSSSAESHSSRPPRML